MNGAILYTRVNNVIQSEEENSARDQEERLRQYCHRNNLVVQGVIREDTSAKNKNGRNWQRLLANVKLQPKDTILLLFIKWDQFGRGSRDAHRDIAALRDIGVIPQAIDQPLNLSISADKMMLEIYLTSPKQKPKLANITAKRRIR